MGDGRQCGVGRGIAVTLGGAGWTVWVSARSGRAEGVMQYAEHLDLSASQSPEGISWVIAALAVDPQLMSVTGQALYVADLARRYGIDVTA